MKATLKSAAFAAVLAGTLGFGAAQAMAAPSAAEQRACNQQACNAQCEARFGEFASGFCEGGECFCAV